MQLIFAVFSFSFRVCCWIGLVLLALQYRRLDGMSLLVSLCLGFLTFGFSIPASAGSATGSGHDKEAILADLKSDVPSGASITGSSCDKIGMPSGGDFAYRCTIDWE